MKLKLKKNPEKERIDNEIRNKQEYMAKIGPGEEYQDCLKELEVLLRLREEMSFWHKLKEAAPVLAVIATVGGTAAGIFTQLHHDKTRSDIAQLAWQKEEKENELKNGTVFNMSKE